MNSLPQTPATRKTGYQTVNGHERTIQGLLKTARTIEAASLLSALLEDKVRLNRAARSIRSAIHDINLLAFEVADACELANA